MEKIGIVLVVEYRVVRKLKKNQIQALFKHCSFCVTTYYCLTYVTLISAANQLFKIIELLPKDCFFSYFCFLSLGTFHNLDFCLNTKLRWRRSDICVDPSKRETLLKQFYFF